MPSIILAILVGAILVITLSQSSVGAGLALPDQGAASGAPTSGRIQDSPLLETIRDPAPRQIIRRQLNRDLVPRQNFNKMHPHLPRNMSQDTVTVLEFNSKHGIGQGLHNGPLDLNDVFLGH